MTVSTGKRRPRFPANMSLEDRVFGSCRVIASGCWEWTRSVTHSGYGELRCRNKYYRAHVVAYRSVNGPVPDGMEVMHTCDNPPCINPGHLKVATHRENMRDMWRKGRDGLSRLTWKDVIEIRSLYNSEKVTNVELGRRFGVTGAMIGYIVNGQSWRVTDGN